MCFRNAMSKKAQAVAARYGRKSNVIEMYEEMMREEKEKKRANGKFLYTAYPHKDKATQQYIYTDHPIITADEEIQLYKWGLIPFWTKNDEQVTNIRTKTYNARSETLFEKPSFREPILHKRCLIPSTGYFEHHHNADGSTTPYYIFLKAEEIFSICGIYDHWTNRETGEKINSFSLITTKANELTGKIHNGGNNPFRMPVIIAKEDEQKWLDPDLTHDEIEKLLHPFPADGMDAYPIRKDFEHISPFDPSIIRKVEATNQGTLF